MLDPRTNNAEWGGQGQVMMGPSVTLGGPGSSVQHFLFVSMDGTVLARIGDDHTSTTVISDLSLPQIRIFRLVTLLLDLTGLITVALLFNNSMNI